MHVAGRTTICGGMKFRGLSVCLALSLLVPACRKPDQVTVEETRVATKADDGQKLDATSNDRFQEPGNSPILASMVPDGWLTLPSSEFRLLNYRFGTSGEVAVGISSGGGLAVNINRWRHQFGADPLDDKQIDALEPFNLLNVQGVWVEAAGDFEPGMNLEKRTGQALAGVIANDRGRIVTVKMTGPEDEVAAQKEALKIFIRGLRYR